MTSLSTRFLGQPRLTKPIFKIIHFHRVGVFTYSDEDSSKSYPLDGKVDGRTMNNRKRKLMSLQRRISNRKNKALVGSEVAVLVEGLSAETDLLWQGRMSTQAPEIDGVVLINDVEGIEPRPGEIRRMRITEAHDYDLVGTLLPATEAAPAPIRIATQPLAGLIQISSPAHLPAR